jgi:hypothetical protein
MVSVTAPVRLGLVSVYPPRPDGPAGHAAALVRALRRRVDVVVCAVDRHGLTYPDEVVAVIADNDPADHRRAGRILAEYAVDAVLIEYDERVDRGGVGLQELAVELRRHGIPYLVAVHDLADPAASLADLTATAARTLVFSDEARDRALALRLADPDRLTVLPADPTAAVARRILTLGRGIVSRAERPTAPPYRLHLDGIARPGPDGTVEAWARLATVAAGLLGRLSDADAAAPSATGWAVAAVDRLEADVAPRDVGWAVLGLGALADAAAPVRGRARTRRNALAAALPTDVDISALAVAGLVGAAPGARRALTRVARGLHRAVRAPTVRQWLADRRQPEAVRVPAALIAAGGSLADEEMVGAGVEALDWYAGRIGLGGADGPARLPAPTERAVDVGATVEAFAAAYRATGRAHHARLARRCFDWFAGVNRYGVMAHDPDTGSCVEALGLGTDGRRTPVAALAYASALLALADAGLAGLEPIGGGEPKLAA